jgi:hypothetical protein
MHYRTYKCSSNPSLAPGGRVLWQACPESVFCLWAADSEPGALRPPPPAGLQCTKRGGIAYVRPVRNGQWLGSPPPGGAFAGRARAAALSCLLPHCQRGTKALSLSFLGGKRFY